MRAKDIMTLEVVSILPEASIGEALRLMLKHRISGLPVIDKEGKLLGIVTEGDFLRRVETGTERNRGGWIAFLMGPGRLAEEYVRTHGRKVAEVMTPDPVTVGEDTRLDAVVDIMEKRRIKRVPVVRGNRVVGIVSRANLLHVLASIACELELQTATDTAIREQLLAVLGREQWVPKSFIDVTVHNGVVELWGSILDERERQAVVVAAENVAGVKHVNDHLVWVEPMTGMTFEPPSEAPPRVEAS
jgi:CBS domain-containing protein